MRPTRVVVDVAQLTVRTEAFVRTGVQEVQYRTLRAIVRARARRPDLELLLLPALPTDVVPARTPIAVLREVERELDLPSDEVWGLDLEAALSLRREDVVALLATADAAHFLSMGHLGPLLRDVRRRGATRRSAPVLSATVYDLVPRLFPEYAAPRLAGWFPAYLDGLWEADALLPISAWTGRDLLEARPAGARARVVPVRLPVASPTEGSPAGPELLEELGLTPGGYLVVVGSVEPRKGLPLLLAGLEHHRRTRGRALRLVLVGATGWKDAAIEARLAASPLRDDLVRTGWLQDARLARLLLDALAVAMPSVYEGFGLPAAQATALGVPVLVGGGSSLPEAAGPDALYVDLHDPLSIAAALDALPRATPGPPPRPETWDDFADRLLAALSPGAAA